MSVFEARRAAEELENFTAASEADPWSEFGDWEQNRLLWSTEEDWSGSLERFPANMDDLGKFARRERNIYTARTVSANTWCVGVGCVQPNQGF